MNISSTSPIQQVAPRIEPPVTQAGAGINLTDKAVQQIDEMQQADREKKSGAKLDIRV